MLTAMYLYNKIYVTANTMLISLAISCGVLTFISNIVRYFGRKTETKLFKEWDGVPTTRWLRHRDHTLDPYTKGLCSDNYFCV